jgi:hypothetical protein
VFLYAFDLLELNGQDVRREPLEVRKRALAAVLRIKAVVGIQLNEHCNDLPAEVVFRHACKLGFEGIVSKRLSVRAIARLAENKEAERIRTEARGGRGLDLAIGEKREPFCLSFCRWSGWTCLFGGLARLDGQE